jgi:hypothetical protein
MSIQRIVGIVLIVVGIVALGRGGIFWTDRDKVIDAGPIQVTTEERKGFAVPEVLGALALVGGVVLLVVPSRRRV